MTMKNVVILGSSGSIGTGALDVARHFKDRLRVVGLAVHSNIEKLRRQVKEFRPSAVAIADERAAEEFKKRAGGVRVFSGRDGVCRLAGLKEADLVLVAVVGSEAIFSLQSAIAAGKTVALANKEAVVMAGPLLLGEAKKRGARVIPIDSEQNAIFQCLEGYDTGMVERVYLTASGGALLDYSKKELKDAAPEKVLAHPRWKMGKKITVDSATLMNKGLEVIEAQQLFGLPIEKIKVLVHRQALIHSMVEFVDGSLLAQMGPTDMRLPIQYALTYPQRWQNGRLKLNPLKMGSLTFEAPDVERFPCLELAYEAGRAGGLAPCVLNAANEVAVEAYLDGKLSFGKIASVVEKTLEKTASRRAPLALSDVFEADAGARDVARRWTELYRKSEA